jgi:hypothetical protein
MHRKNKCNPDRVNPPITPHNCGEFADCDASTASNRSYASGDENSFAVSTAVLPKIAGRTFALLVQHDIRQANARSCEVETQNLRPKFGPVLLLTFRYDPCSNRVGFLAGQRSLV